MKRVLSIFFGLLLIIGMVGCKTTKVETLVEEKVFPADITLEVIELEYLGDGKWNRESLGMIDVPLDGKVKLETSKSGYIFKSATYSQDIGTGKKVELEYFVFDNREMLKVTEIYPPNTFSEKKIGKIIDRGVPIVTEHDRRKCFYVFGGGCAPLGPTLEKFETSPLFN